MRGTTHSRAQHDKCSVEVPYKQNSVSIFDHGPHQSSPGYQNLFLMASMDEVRLRTKLSRRTSGEQTV
jgi:hypothetical protein